MISMQQVVEAHNLKRMTKITTKEYTTCTGRWKHFVHSDICLLVQNVSTAHLVHNMPEQKKLNP